MLSPEFIETHLDAFLQQQIGRQKSGLLLGQPRPDQILNADFEDSPEGRVRREIILDLLHDALGRGLVMEKNDVLEKLGASMEGAETISELAGLVRVTDVIFPSIQERNWNPQPLLEALVRGAEASEQIQRKRLFLKALNAGKEQFPEQVSLAMSSINIDLLTRQTFELSTLNSSETL